MASPNEQLLFAAKTDASEIIETIFTTLPPDEFDVNHQDGLGNTALHYAASTPSPTVLEQLLEHDGTDVDLKNRIEGDTPLHLAVKLENEDARLGVVEMLLDAGADPRIVDKHGLNPASYLHVESSAIDKQIQRALAIAMAEMAIGGVDDGDIASGDEDDGAPGSGSGSGSD